MYLKIFHSFYHRPADAHLLCQAVELLMQTASAPRAGRQLMVSHESRIVCRAVVSRQEKKVTPLTDFPVKISQKISQIGIQPKVCVLNISRVRAHTMAT